MKTITLLNEKGGVTKTTLAIHIAAGMAINGYRVLLIDSDPQGTIGYYFGIVPDDNYYALVAQDARWDDILWRIPAEQYEPPNTQAIGMIDLVTGNKGSRNVFLDVRNSAALKQRLHEVADRYDLCIIDTAPTPSLAMSLIYEATDGIIYPTELSRLSLQSLLNSLQVNHGAEVLGVIPTKTRLRTVEQSENLKLLQSEVGAMLWGGTSLSITWDEAAGQSRTVYAYAPDSQAATQMWAIIGQVEKAIAYEQT